MLGGFDEHFHAPYESGSQDIESGTGEWAQVPPVVRKTIASLLAKQSSSDSENAPYFEIQRINARLEILEQNSQGQTQLKAYCTMDQLKSVTVKLLRSVHATTTALEDMQHQLQIVYAELQELKTSQPRQPSDHNWTQLEQRFAQLNASISRQDEAISAIQKDVSGLNQLTGAEVSFPHASINPDVFVENPAPQFEKSDLPPQNFVSPKQTDVSSIHPAVGQVTTAGAMTLQFVSEEEEEVAHKTWTKVDPFPDEDWSPLDGQKLEAGHPTPTPTPGQPESVSLTDVVDEYRVRSRVIPEADPAALLQCFLGRVQDRSDRLRVVTETVFKGKEQDIIDIEASFDDTNQGNDVSQEELANLLVQVGILPSKEQLGVVVGYINRDDGLFSKAQFVELCLLWNIYERVSEWWEDNKNAPFWDVSALEGLVGSVGVDSAQHPLGDLIDKSKQMEPAYELMFAILWAVLVAEAK